MKLNDEPVKANGMEDGHGSDGAEAAGEVCGGAGREGLGAEAQLELGLRASGAVRPRRGVRTRRYAAARWWFAQMREAVRTTPEWTGTQGAAADGGQVVLSLTQAPTRLERRAA